MIGESVSSESVAGILIDIKEKIEQGQISACSELIDDLLADTKIPCHCIDKEYMDMVVEKKRKTRIKHIGNMLRNMSLSQIDNVYRYVTDELDEPNHESQALDAIIRLSRKGNQ